MARLCPKTSISGPLSETSSGTLSNRPHFRQSFRQRIQIAFLGQPLPGKPGFSILPLMVCVALVSVGCRQEMYNQPKHEPLELSYFFDDGMSARPLVPGTVARGYLRDDLPFFTGLAGTNLVTEFPVAVTLPLLQRGQERYNIYCAVCHGPTGEGNGMIVQRGFPQPPSYHIERLRQAPIGHFYRVMTYGYGVMYSYATRVAPEDRWAIAAYIRALQLSQNATLTDVPAPERANLEVN